MNKILKYLIFTIFFSYIGYSLFFVLMGAFHQVNFEKLKDKEFIVYILSLIITNSWVGIMGNWHSEEYLYPGLIHSINSIITSLIVWCRLNKVRSEIRNNEKLDDKEIDLFCKRIKELREEAGLTTKQVSEIIKLEESLYIRYEEGKDEPYIRLLFCLANLFHTSVDYFLGRTDERDFMSKMNSPFIKIRK